MYSSIKDDKPLLLLLDVILKNHVAVVIGATPFSYSACEKPVEEHRPGVRRIVTQRVIIKIFRS
ncbi:MAG: hypothetical protein CMJ19_21475 [Phycisphaeraceae bacterium]|nr:hypothetical protein [Phycisphaeraceae bacterium]